MDYQILPILEPAEVDRILLDLSRQSFLDGRLTALGGARSVKKNLQMDRAGAFATEIEQLVLSGLKRNETFQAFAYPRRVMPPIFSRYEPGMEYGAHVDGAIMPTATEPMRTDLAITLFLSQPDSYEGGELILRLPSGEEEIKLAAGEAVVYSAKYVHRVGPVRSGVRLAAVSWVQSAVRDERMRALLYDLHLALRTLPEHDEAALLVSKSYHNLLRLVSEL
ncbi:MAG TPA: Fe2+-dependent dioxygenase [Bryobacteraceae bacterium]|nr:Fe2+-dependent dioxygenase [Bryobacteraceae bacterium]